MYINKLTNTCYRTRGAEGLGCTRGPDVGYPHIHIPAKQTTVMTANIGVGRCLGYILGTVPLAAITRHTLADLVPLGIAAENTTPFNDNVRAWLRRAEKAARVRRGVHIVAPLNPGGLRAEATKGLDTWRGSDFMDIGQAMRAIAAREVPPVLARQVVAEVAWLTSLGDESWYRAT